MEANQPLMNKIVCEEKDFPLHSLSFIIVTHIFKNQFTSKMTNKKR